MKRFAIYLLIFTGSHIVSVAQTVYRTRILEPNLKTLQVELQGQKFQLPIITLNGSEKLLISFDEMSHNSHAYNYKVVHCNADWTLSNLSTNEYLSGFTTGSISNYVSSLNTTMLYTHYSLNLPNQDMNFKISGNYVVIIYEDNQTDKPVAYACFSVVEPKIRIAATVRGNTDTELNDRLQQLDFDLDLTGYTVREPSTEIKVFVRQNNRIDNEVTDLQPTYITSDKLSYTNNKSLIFDGGSEYRRFDISSVYAAGEGVASIRYNRPDYDATLYEDKIATRRSYLLDMDVNGRYVVNVQNSDYDDTEADYMFVHFTLLSPEPFFDGQLYVGGEFNLNLMNEVNRMKYNPEKGAYTADILLKQGGYNYQYWFVPKGARAATTERVEGNHWQTKNEYTIYVYHRGWGERYDRLIGVKNIE